MNKKLISDMDKFAAETQHASHDSLKHVPFDKYFEWCTATHMEQTQLGQEPNKQPPNKQPPNKQPPNKQPPNKQLSTAYDRGALKRIFNISSLKYAVLPNMLNGITVVFKLYDAPTKKEVNYTTLFCENIGDMPSRLYNLSLKEQRIGNNVLQHYSVYPSFVSCDGEYRGGFTRYSEFINAKIEYADIWDEIESFVIKLMAKRQWIIKTSYFYETQDDSDLDKTIKTNLLARSFLVLAWFHAVYNDYLGLTEAHVNAAFKDIFLAHKKIDSEFMRELLKKYKEADVEMLRVKTSHIVHPVIGSKSIRYIPLGYKMIPLNLREVQHPLKLQYKPWREVIVAGKCNDLIINQVAPGFPITLDWFLIVNSHKGLFDNKSQYERMKNSELATGILDLLRTAQQDTYFSNNKHIQRQMQWINNKFKKLNDKIQDPMNFAVDELIMSDITLSFPSEFVGRTFADTLQLIKKSKIYDKKLGSPLQNYKMFAKYIFEICYNLLVANKRIGVIHSDLHLNNATIGFLYAAEPKDLVVYEIEQAKYTFTNNGYFSCLIDFSRSLLDPNKHDSFTDDSLPHGFHPVNTAEYSTFEDKEISTILTWYLQLFPAKKEQRDELLAMFKKNYTAAFKLLTAADLYMFASRLLSMLDNSLVHKRCIELLEQIIKLSNVFITTDLTQLMNDHSMSSAVINADFPIQQIIKKCFAEFTAASSGTVTDYYVLNNPISKSINKYENFPNVLKYSKYYDSKGNAVDIDSINKAKKNSRDAYEKKKLYGFENLKFIAKKYVDTLE